MASSKKSSKGQQNSKNDNGKICAILAYFLVGIIWYFVDESMKKDQNVKFHVKQALVLMVFSIAWSIVLGILFSILFMGFLFFLLGIFSLLSYVPLVLGIIGIINAANGKQTPIPFIGKYAEKLTF